MDATERLLLGIDIGTTNIKAGLFTPTGRLVRQAQQEYPTHRPKPGWVEQHPEDWWRGTVSTVRSVMEGIPPEQVAAVGVSGQGCAVTLIDQQGNSLRPAIIWMDTRSEAYCERLRQTCAETILAVNGKQPAAYNADPKLMWLMDHEPETINAARCSLTTTAYVNFRLTRQTVMNKSDASLLFAFDLHQQDWSPELISAFGLPARLYPSIIDCQAIIGGVCAEAAQELGLKPETPVIAGGEDTSSAGLALGIGRTGQAYLSLGTAGTIYVANEQTQVHRDLLTFQHVLPNTSLIGGSMIAAGAALEWCRQLLPGDLSFEALSQLASKAAVGSGGVLFLPYLNGELQPINDGYARGVYFGLGFDTGTAELVRATMEGVAFAVEHNLSIIRRLGIKVERLQAVGKPARNPFWCQLIADVTGHPVEVIPENSGAPLGNALLCASSLRLIDEPVKTAQLLNRHAHSYEPQPTAHEQYRDMFEIYQRLYPALKDQFAHLNQRILPKFHALTTSS